MIEIARVDPADAVQVRTWHGIYRDAWRAFDPTQEIMGLDECGAMLASQPNATRAYEAYVARQDGRAIGSATLGLRLTDNASRCAPFVHTTPGHGGHGVGTVLLAHLEERARQLGKRVAAAAPRQDMAPAMALARRFGYVAGLTNVERTLQLPVAPALLARLGAASASYVAPYRVACVDAPLPEPLLPSYCDLKNRMNLDAPSVEDLEAGGLTPAAVRAQEQQLEALGQVRMIALGLDAADTVIALSELIVPTEGDALWQAGTIVAPEARGHRLGMATKVANLERAQRRYPARRLVTTNNVDANEHMIAINDALGFVVRARFVEMSKQL